jgi:hypothetical protein
MRDVTFWPSAEQRSRLATVYRQGSGLGVRVVTETAVRGTWLSAESVG